MDAGTTKYISEGSAGDTYRTKLKLDKEVGGVVLCGFQWMMDSRSAATAFINGVSNMNKDLQHSENAKKTHR